MKTVLLTFSLLFSLLAPSAFAQPTLTQAVHQPQMGDSFLNDSWATIANPGPAGPNANWNFTLAPPTFQVSDTITYVPLPAVQWLPFTQATICARHRIRYDSVFIDERYDYFLPGPGSWKYEGFYHSLVADNGPSVFYNPIHNLSFPMTYGDLVVDSTYGNYYSIGVFPFNGFAYLEADGYGTLTINGNTFPNVLRVHEWDSLNWQTRPFRERYRFFQENNRFPILTLEGNANYWDPYTNQGVLLGQEEADLSKLSIYPNPSQGLVRVQTNGHSGSLSIYDAAGKLIRQSNIDTHVSLQVDLSQEPPGLYLLRWKPAGMLPQTHKLKLFR